MYWHVGLAGAIFDSRMVRSNSVVIHEAVTPASGAKNGRDVGSGNRRSSQHQWSGYSNRTSVCTGLSGEHYVKS